MKVLIWTPPWIGQGRDLYFGLNAFKNHLYPQAEILAAKGFDVSVAFPKHFQGSLEPQSSKVSHYPIDGMQLMNEVVGWQDPTRVLYEESQLDLSANIANWIRRQLPKSVDCVLLWETDKSFLQILYPDALIVSQMPGVFSREPFPSTVTFDPVGLYKNGALFSLAEQIIGGHYGQHQWVGVYSETAKRILGNLKLTTKETARAILNKEKLALLPLQVSGHYAFDAETKLHSQSQLVQQALTELPVDHGMLLTEYRSKHYSSNLLKSEYIDHLARNEPRVLHLPIWGSLSSSSQHLLGIVDEIMVATSSLGLQALIWDIPIRVLGDTWLKPFDENNVHSEQARRNAVSFMLSMHQPLTSVMFESRGFLASILEELHGRRKLQLKERFVDFCHIEKHYSDKVLQRFETKNIRKSLNKLGVETSENNTTVLDLKSLIENTKPELISFDLFDTLVNRPLEAPADLYGILEQRARLAGCDLPFDFAAKRLSAEIAARGSIDAEEIQLQDIYNCLVASEFISESTAQQVQKIEIETEVELSGVRVIGKQLFSLVEQTGIEICITSDMYLPKECIEQILEKNGYPYNKIFLSSEFRKTKRTGALFGHILREFNLKPDRVIHIGDNSSTDIRPAQLIGIKTFHIKKAIDNFRQNRSVVPSISNKSDGSLLSRSITIGTIANKLFDDPGTAPLSSISAGDPFRLGYAAVGPAVFDFCRWLQNSVIENGVDRLYFLSREGRILLDVFQILETETPSNVETRYLLASRRAIRVAALKSKSDIFQLYDTVVDRNATVEAVLVHRFGLQPDLHVDEAISQAGFSSGSIKLTQLDRETARARFMHLLELLADRILLMAEKERESYLAYLKSVGMLKHGKNAVVDVGWSANMQGDLHRLIQQDLQGYYMATIAAARKWNSLGNQIHSYYASFSSNKNGFPFIGFRHVVEYLLCDTNPSFIKFEQNQGGFVPIHQSAIAQSRINIVKPIHDGIRAYARDRCLQENRIGIRSDCDKDLSFALLNEFLSKPQPADARLLMGETTEDQFSGRDTKYHLKPDSSEPTLPDMSQSDWKPGARAILRGTTKRKIANHSEVERYSAYRRKILRIARPVISMRVGGNREMLRTYDNKPAFFFNNAEYFYERLIGRIILGRRVKLISR